MNDLAEPAATIDPLVGGLEPVRAGSPVEPLAAAYDLHQKELYSFALRTTRDAEAAADLVQEAFLRLVREVSEGRTPDNVRAWLYRVVANLATSRGRRATVADRFLRILSAGDPVEPPDASYLAREARTELDALLGTLSRDERLAVLLSAHDFDGVEIAAALGRTHLATRALLCRARAKLRERASTPEAYR